MAAALYTVYRMHGEPILRRNLHDEVASRIRDLIIEGELAPGTRIYETQLGQSLGVSRTPLREALKTLASEGLIELATARGAVVKRFSEKEVRDMLDVLAVLEAFAARLACERASDADIAGMRELHDRMAAFFEAGNRLEYYKLNQAFHSGLLRLSGNGTLEGAHLAIQSRIKRIRYVGNSEPQKWRDAMAEHERMIRHLEARDAGRLAQVLAEHMAKTWERVKGTLQPA
jgi:DNA-binding GntR family transcriptional regulator